MPAALLSLCLALAPAPQGPPTEIVPLDHLVQRGAEPRLPPWGTLLEQDVARPPNLLAAGESRTISTDAVVAMLQQLCRTAVEGGRLEFSVAGTALLATGEPADVAQAVGMLRHATAVLARPVTIELAVWDAADRVTPAAVLGPVEYTRFAANRAPIWRRTATAPGGEAVGLEHVRWSHYVRSLNIEVAQKVSISNPRPAAYGDGCHAVARAFPLHGVDEFALHVQFAVSQRRGVVRTLPTGMAGAADLELPLLESDFGAVSGRVANGGALAVTMRGQADGGGHRIVTARVLAAGPAGAVHDGFGIFPCGALTSSSLVHRVRAESDGLGLGGSIDDDVDPGHGRVDAEHLAELVQKALGDDDTGRVAVEVVAGWLLVQGPDAAQARVDALLRGVQERLLRNATVAHTGTLVLADGNAAAAVPTLHELVAPTLVGRELTLHRCLESPVVARLDSAVAQETASVVPVIETMQSGCWVTARLSPHFDGCHLRLRAQQRHGVVPQARSVMPGGGTWMPAEITRVSASHDGAVANGQALDHGDGPAVTVDGRSQRSTLATSVRW